MTELDQKHSSKEKKRIEKKRKGRLRKLPFILIFLIGLGILLYPLVSRFYYRIESSNQVEDFRQARQELDPAEVERRMELARAFNDSLNNVVTEDPYSEEKRAEGIARYAEMLELREKIGTVTIPAIDVELPIYAGTSEEVLQKGVGHLEGTSLPIGGESSHTVITAHSGLPEARLFTDLEKLKIGDKFYIENIEGIMAYQIDHLDIIDPTDFSQLLIEPGHDYATLLTCTPIMINTHRFIARGHRIEYIPAVEDHYMEESVAAYRYRTLFFVALAIIFVLLVVIIVLRRKKAKLEREIKKRKSQEIDSVDKRDDRQ